jgi:AraC family transcriptional regulator of adaptative response / DNA-3-methyladenine glycosylase II
MLIRAMVGQQITVTAARTALTALADALGERVEIGPERDGVAAPEARLFPTMAAIAERGHEVLRGPTARTRAIVGAAHALADGTLSLSAGDEAADQRAALLAMPGIGPWTADYVRMRVIGDTDVFLPGDVAVRTGAAAVGLAAEARALEQWAVRTAPWRSYLTAHLWRAVPPRPPRGGSVVGSSAVPPPHPSPDITPAPPVRRPGTEEALK